MITWDPIIRVIKTTFASLGSMSLFVGPFCTGLMNAWFILVRSRQRYTVLFGLGTMTKLLHHSADSSTPSGADVS